MTLEIPLIVAIIAGLITSIGWFVSHRNNQTSQRRKDQLDLVNKQLSDLYGPLYISCESGRAAYFSLLKKLGREGGIFNEQRPASDDEVREWFHWMKHVLAPMNEHRHQLIMKSSHLIIEEQVPRCFLEFAAHVAGYRAVLAKWETGDFSERYPHYAFPDELDKYAEATFTVLKKKQAKLLGELR
jgi:hypothetical protein